jgi:hypothetical protein
VKESNVAEFVYKRTEAGLWTVGHYDPNGNKWVPESDHESPGEAITRVIKLNGGNPVPPTLTEVMTELVDRHPLDSILETLAERIHQRTLKPHLINPKLLKACENTARELQRASRRFE